MPLRNFSILGIIILVGLVYPLLPSAHAQGQGEVIVQQSDDTVKIAFTINAGRPGDLCKVSLLVSSDGGLTYNIRPQLVQGLDRLFKVGQMQKISWVPLRENMELDGDKYVFNIVGEVVQISDNVDFINVTGSTFSMGDSSGSGESDERPIHRIAIGNFDIGRYEVTNRQYVKFLNEYKSADVKSGEFAGERLLFEDENGIHRDGYAWTLNPGFEDSPVRNVTWFGANEFCRHNGFRLPTEAEWEYAARVGGKTVKYGNGKDDPDPDEINYNGLNDTIHALSSDIKFRNMPTRVGSFPPNGLGLYDMSGNVWEWCQDWYNEGYYSVLLDDPRPNPTGPWFGNFKVIRGGGFGNDSHGVRVTERSYKRPSLSNIDIGFRVVRKSTNTRDRE